MDTSIYDQFLKCYSCHFTSDRIKWWENYCLRSIINDKVYTCQGLHSTDITSLTSDNTSLHLIAWKLHYGNSSLGNMVYRTFLNGIYHIFLGFLSCLFLRLALKFLVKSGNINFNIVFHRSEQFFFCLFGGQTGNTFQFLYSFQLEFIYSLFFLLQFSKSRCALCLALLNCFSFLINGFFLR